MSAVFEVDNRTLDDLLMEVDKLFRKRRKRTLSETIDYSLDKFPSGWRFSVVNDWHKWNDKKLQCQTDLYCSPKYAVAAFLEYVRTGGVNVRKLMS